MHTPGPWTIQEQADGHLGIYQTHALVATIRHKPEESANARLIAAAPDLLAALEACLPIVDAHRRYALGEGDVTAMTARATIARAKGAAS